MTVYDISDGRIKVFFDRIPDEEIRWAMKHSGFIWNKNGRFWHAEYSEEREALMSVLLYGKKVRKMRSIAEVAGKYRHICWYPSAGMDFLGLYFLSEEYYKYNNVPLDDGQMLPDLFIFTDVSPCVPMNEPEKNGAGMEELKSGKTDLRYPLRDLICDYTVKAISVEKLKDIPDMIDSSFCAFSEHESYKGKAYYIKAVFHKWSKFEKTVHFIYAFGENTLFARDVLLKEHIPVEYAIQVRYGNAFGGSYLRGDWYKHITGELGCKYFISNRGYMECDVFVDRERTAEFFSGHGLIAPRYSKLYSIDGSKWSGYGDVVWYKLDHSTP